MKARLTRILFCVSLGAACGPRAFCHDLMASLCTVRLKAVRVELEIKVAAESLWPVVQESGAPGTIFVLEDFEAVGKPRLVAFARAMEEVTVGGAALPLHEAGARVVEDNFVLTLVYPRPTAGIVTIRETYLSKMPPGYLSRVRCLDEQGELVSAKTLRGSDIIFEIPLPPLPGRPPDTLSPAAK